MGSSPNKDITKKVVKELNKNRPVLTDSEQAESAAEPKQEQPTEPERKTPAYKGFLHLVCENCGAPSTFNAKTPVRDFQCKACGYVTPLMDLGDMTLSCECGKVWHYRTNALERLVEVNCVACHSPMIGEMDKHGDYRPLRN